MKLYSAIMHATLKIQCVAKNIFKVTSGSLAEMQVSL